MDTTSPSKLTINDTPLRRMNTTSTLSSSSRRKTSHLAELYTPSELQQQASQIHHQQQQQQQQPQNGYRKLSIGSKSSPLAQKSVEKSHKRMSGINFNIPVVTADKEPTIRSPSSSPLQALSPNQLVRPTSNESMPSPSPKGHMRSRSDLSAFQHGAVPVTISENELPKTPNPSQRNFEAQLMIQQTPQEDELAAQLRDLASKELELLEIKETIKTLVNKKRSMEMEFEVLKRSVERSLHKQINPTTTSRKQYPVMPSPRTMRSPNRSSHHRTVSDHPLDDNFNTVSPTNSMSQDVPDLRHQIAGSKGKMNNMKRQSGLWGIISQVDNYIQTEFEKFNIIDLNPGQEKSMDESFYQVPSGESIPSEENKIKKLLDMNSSPVTRFPQSFKNVVDAVIYGSIEEEEDTGEDSQSLDLKSLLQQKLNTMSETRPLKSVEMKDFSKNSDGWDNSFDFDD